MKWLVKPKVKSSKTVFRSHNLKDCFDGLLDESMDGVLDGVLEGMLDGLLIALLDECVERIAP